jgi:hypothetical protein
LKAATATRGQRAAYLLFALLCVLVGEIRKGKRFLFTVVRQVFAAFLEI